MTTGNAGGDSLALPGRPPNAVSATARHKVVRGRLRIVVPPLDSAASSRCWNGVRISSAKVAKWFSLIGRTQQRKGPVPGGQLESCLPRAKGRISSGPRSRDRARAEWRRPPTSNPSNPCNLGNPSAVYTLYPGPAGRYAARRLDRTGTRPGDRAGEKMRELPTSLQQACNLLATSLQLLPLPRHCYGVAPLPLRGHDRVPPAERPRSCAVGAPPCVVVPARYAGAKRTHRMGTDF